jgi:hypothetical protein
MLYRCLTNFVIEDGNVGFRGIDGGHIVLEGASRIGANSPSFLKAMGFGYSKAALIKAVNDCKSSYDLPCEKIMSGELIFPRK